MRFVTTALVLLPLALTACVATAPPSKPSAPIVPKPVTKTFSGCFVESKLPWLVSVVAADKSNTKPLEALVADFVGGMAVDQQRALNYLQDLQRKQYASGEHMAGAHFNACMARGTAEKFEPERAVGCYKEQRIIFALEGLRFDARASQSEAAAHLIAANPSTDGSTEGAIRRLANDTYNILKPGGESAFSEAQFRICMTTP